MYSSTNSASPTFQNHIQDKMGWNNWIFQTWKMKSTCYLFLQWARVDGCNKKIVKPIDISNGIAKNSWPVLLKFRSDNNFRAFQTIAEIKTTNFGFCPLKFTQLFNQSVEVFVYTTCGWEGRWVEHREHPWRTLHTTFHSYCCSQATRVIEFVELK